MNDREDGFVQRLTRFARVSAGLTGVAARAAQPVYLFQKRRDPPLLGHGRKLNRKSCDILWVKVNALHGITNTLFRFNSLRPIKNVFRIRCFVIWPNNQPFARC